MGLLPTPGAALRVGSDLHPDVPLEVADQAQQLHACLYGHGLVCILPDQRGSAMVQVHGFDLRHRVVYRDTGPFREPRQRHFAVIEQHALRDDACAAHTGGILLSVEVEASHVALNTAASGRPRCSSGRNLEPAQLKVARYDHLADNSSRRAAHVRPDVGSEPGGRKFCCALLFGL